MRNPFDSSDDITKQEISNFVFYGRKNKFDKVDYSYDKLLPNLLNYQMKEILANADKLRNDITDFNSLMDTIYNYFIPIAQQTLNYDDINCVEINDEFINFLVRVFKQEVSFKEMLKVFKKRNRIICHLLKNREILREILDKIKKNSVLNDYIHTENLNYRRIVNFLCYSEFSPAYHSERNQYKSNAELFFEDLQKLFKIECSLLFTSEINKLMPTKIHQTIKDFLGLMYSLITGQTRDMPSFDGIVSKETAYNLLEPLPEGHILFRKKCIVFEDMNFETGEHVDMIYNLVKSGLLKGCYIGFNQCYFERGFILDAPYAPKCSLFYKDCTFSKSFHIKNCSSSTLLRFYNCDFFGKVIFGDAKIKYLPCDIEIRSSTLKPYSTLEISNITEMDGTHYGKVALINTIINGNFKLVNLAKKSNTLFNIHNIALTMPFIIENCYFNKETVITGLSFAATPKQAMKDSIRTFAKSLQISGLNNLIIENGLSDDETDNATLSGADKDIQAYKIACESGFLKPKYAASYLGMSKDNLAKKRMADKQRITRESIPYVGQGKSISYPKDALDAYNSQDWDLLKKLREKYAQKDTGTDDSE